MLRTFYPAGLHIVIVVLDWFVRAAPSFIRKYMLCEVLFTPLICLYGLAALTNKLSFIELNNLRTCLASH